MATVDDIVRVSGVSRSTVFRFLNGSNVRADAQKAIIQAMKDLKYKTDAIYKQQNIVIEISTSQDFDSFKGFTEVVQGIVQRADEKGLRVQLVRRTGTQITQDYDRWNAGDELRGVIIVGKNIADEQKEADMLITKNIPHIFVNRMMDNPSISYVAVNLKQAAFDMVSYLISRGYKDIAVYGNPKNLKADLDKLEGYKQAFLKNDIKVSDVLYCEGESGEDWERWLRLLLEKSRVPQAYFGICDSYAMKFIHTAQSMGYRVPEDIAVVGMDDVETAQYFKPALTTVHVPFKKMGILAVDNILQLITDEEVSNVRMVVKHKLVIRESCGKAV